MLQLVTHRPNQPQPKICFYILNKGSNSGKPLNAPCANCFVAFFENENEKEFYNLYQSYSYGSKYPGYI